MKAYVVGGAVRDELLGLPVQDRDHVVVGATAEEMAALGYQPVGKDFPVFLHPQTHEEYALARTERKSGRGYKGFTVYAAPDVTLEEDLARRDLTINAMARGPDGELVDPFGGKRDLEAGILRHVGEAFHEDPVRILRVARFAARFGFRIADETMALMKLMVDNGEADHLVPERVWQEFARGLSEAHPELMFDALERCDFRPKLLPELRDIPRRYHGALPVRFAVLCWTLEEAELRGLCARLRAPNEERDLALVACRCRGMLGTRRPAEVLAMFKAADALRRPERFAQFLEAAGQRLPEQRTDDLQAALDAALAVDAGAAAASAASPAEIPACVERARERAIAARLAP